MTFAPRLGSYTNWTLPPSIMPASSRLVVRFRSADDEFHVGWIGAWADGATMGAGMQRYRRMGEDLAQDFDNVIDCSGSHMLTSTCDSPRMYDSRMVRTGTAS